MFKVNDPETFTKRLMEEFSIPIRHGYTVVCETTHTDILSFVVSEESPTRITHMLPREVILNYVGIALAKFIAFDFYPTLVRNQLKKSKLRIAPKDLARVAELVISQSPYEANGGVLNGVGVQLGLSRIAAKMVLALDMERELYFVQGMIDFRLKHLTTYINTSIASALDRLQQEKDEWEFLTMVKQLVSSQKSTKEEVHIVVNEDEEALIFDRDGFGINAEDLYLDEGLEFNEYNELLDILVSTLMCYSPKKVVIHNPYKIDLSYNLSYKMTLEVFSNTVVECQDCERCEMSEIF